MLSLAYASRSLASSESCTASTSCSSTFGFSSSHILEVDCPLPSLHVPSALCLDSLECIVAESLSCPRISSCLSLLSIESELLSFLCGPPFLLNMIYLLLFGYSKSAFMSTGTIFFLYPALMAGSAIIFMPPLLVSMVSAFGFLVTSSSSPIGTSLKVFVVLSTFTTSSSSWLIVFELFCLRSSSGLVFLGLSYILDIRATSSTLGLSICYSEFSISINIFDWYYYWNYWSSYNWYIKSK